MTSFVGRRQAAAEVKHALSSSRLVTLTGVGGTGKTRLALHVARRLERTFADGVCLVELDKLRDPSLVADTVATALGLTDRSKRGCEILSGYLRARELLLVLDNCEHLVEACAALTGSLLPVAPKLKMLVTSREPLGVSGEHVWPVPALSLPPDDAVPGNGHAGRYEALTLFEQRAAAVVPGFALSEDNIEPVTRLCRRLDGLPLGIELAAARLRAMSVEQILVHLQDRFRLLTRGNRAAAARHQTLRAAVEWSFDLCSEQERGLWAKLSVFAGDFDLAAAKDVCADDHTDAEQVLTGIADLVDKSVLAKTDDVTGSRYRMLGTIGQYGREQLSRGDETFVRKRHRDHYLRLARNAKADWFGPHQVDWVNRIAAEYPNLREALEFCLTQPGEARAGLTMANALSWYWGSYAVRDGRRWLDRALTCDTRPSLERAKVLWADGWVSIAQGDIGQALDRLYESVDLARGFGDETTLGNACHFIGAAKWFETDLPGAAAAYDEALRHYRKAGTVTATASTLCNLSTVVGMQGDAERALALCRECIAICREHGEQSIRGWGLWHLAFAYWLQHNLGKVTTHAKEALRLKIPLHDRVGIGWCLELLGWVAATNDPVRAAVLFGISAGVSKQNGSQTAQDWKDHHRNRVREAIGQASYDAAVARGERYALDDALAYALEERPAPPAETPLEAAELSELTRREREVASLVGKGMSNKDIGATLVVSQRTAESHIQNILVKLGFTSRSQIASWIGRQPDR